MHEQGEAITPLRSGLELIELIEQDEAVLEQARRQLEEIIASESVIINEAQARIDAVKNATKQLEAQITGNYNDLQRSVLEDANESPHYSAGILFGHDLASAKQIESGIDDFNKLIMVPNTPVLRVTSSKYTLGTTAGEPLIIEFGRTVDTSKIAIPLKSRVDIRRSNGYEGEMGSAINRDDKQFDVRIAEALYPVKNTVNPDELVRPWGFEFEGLLVGTDAINSAISIMNIHEAKSDDISDVLRSRIFSFWIANKLNNLEECGVIVSVHEETIDKWREQVKLHAFNSLLSAADRRRGDLMNPSLLKSALLVMNITEAETEQIFNRAVEDSAWANEPIEYKDRRKDLLKVVLKHDLGLTLQEQI